MRVECYCLASGNVAPGHEILPAAITAAGRQLHVDAAPKIALKPRICQRVKAWLGPMR